MEVLARKKRVTDPFNDEAKARLVGGDDDSPCLSELMHDFLEDNDKSDDNSAKNDFDSERVDLVANCIDTVDELLMLNESNASDSYKNLLLAHASEAADKFAFLNERNSSTYM